VREWLEDTIDQVVLGEVLAKSSVTCGPRFGLIAVDNAVEFMLVAYVEIQARLVGKPKPLGIPRKEWEETKRQFPSLLSYVVLKEAKLLALQHEISGFHDIRNDLYHTGTPITVSERRVKQYSAKARECLDILFGISFTQENWADYLTKVASVLCDESQSVSPRPSIVFQSDNDLVKVSNLTGATTRQAIMLVLHGFGTLKGKPPTRAQLSESLARSGQSVLPKNLSNRISDLRNEELILAHKLALTGRGQKDIRKEFVIET
jgi:hypothetical protein